MERTIQRICEKIDSLQQDRILVAIDGSCTAGKTTLAARLEKKYDCNVFHMDDFFLRPEQKTAERQAEIGGNVDYERFYQEVLLPLQAGEPFFYRPYACKLGALQEPVAVTPKKVNIIEGSYSHHPWFGDAYDLRVYLQVSEEVRRQRILQRPVSRHRLFFDQWIPMEQRYFAQFSIGQKSDIAAFPEENK